MNRPARFMLTVVLVGILMGTVLALGTRNAIRATDSALQTQIDELQATMEQREADYQAQLDAANQTAAQLGTTLRERNTAHRAQVRSAENTIADQQETIELAETELVQAYDNAGYMQATFNQNEQQLLAQLEAANQTILQLEGK